MSPLSEILSKEDIGLILSLDYRTLSSFTFDFSKENKELANVNVSDPVDFSAYINSKLDENNAVIGIGKYNEEREIYLTQLFYRKRTVHLGVDLWVPAGTSVLAPLDAEYFLVENRDSGKGDFGPRIILKHIVQGVTFYTMYAHLSLASLDGKKKGQVVRKGEQVGEVGNFPLNGNWPPHLHFQIVRDLSKMKGVVTLEERDEFVTISPDPNMILRIGVEK